MKRCWLLLCLVSTNTVAGAEPIEFARDVLPILSANCFACHGPDAAERQADLRLDVEANAKADGGSGPPIVPGRPELSTIIERMTSDDPELPMPPPSSHKTLKPEQIETVRRWIAEGAAWQRHWSFQPLVKPAGTLDDQVRAGLKPRAASSCVTSPRRIRSFAVCTWT
ncbi:MAG: c-type cytochrome domain-containing protein [Pirellulaceae bacterium]